MCDAELTLKAVIANVKERAKHTLNRIMEKQSTGRFKEACLLKYEYEELIYVLSLLGVDREEIGHEYE
tara:strand:- start:1010 stop:1213 length:204 start_codon:yes stop_codon:yes gene_type:complete